MKETGFSGNECGQSKRLPMDCDFVYQADEFLFGMIPLHHVHVPINPMEVFDIVLSTLRYRSNVVE